MGHTFRPPDFSSLSHFRGRLAEERFRQVFDYLTDILMDADSGIITQIHVLEAGGDEARDAVDLVRVERAAHENQIEGLSIDGARCCGK